MNMQSNTSSLGLQTRAEVTNSFIRSVYNWMVLGLGMTAFVSLLISRTSLSDVVFSQNGHFILIGSIIAEFALVLFISARINTLSATMAPALFLIYSVLNGISLSFIVARYTEASVAQAFLTTTGMFAAISFYGLVTKRDLTGIGSFCMMALFGIILATIVNIFLGSSLLSLGISVFGVIIFVGLTAYDTQRLKEMGESIPMEGSPEAQHTLVRRGSILGALTLYLDFINLFLMLLRIMGNRD